MSASESVEVDIRTLVLCIAFFVVTGRWWLGRAVTKTHEDDRPVSLDLRLSCCSFELTALASLQVEYAPLNNEASSFLVL
jgi:hypothetical protein